MRLLFICNQNQHRSKTAEEMLSKSHETESAGLYNEKPVTNEQIQWADAILVMEEHQRKELVKRFPALCLTKRILNLNIPDIYHYNQPELKANLATALSHLQDCQILYF